MKQTPLRSTFLGICVAGAFTVSLAVPAGAQCEPSTPSAPSTPSPGAPSPGSPGGPGSGYGVPLRGTPFGGALADVSLRWDVWWSLHEDLLLDVRRAGGSVLARSGSDGFYLGSGAASASFSARPSANALREEVLPLLARALDDPTETVRAAALQALARAGSALPASERGAVLAQLAKHLDAESPLVAEAAVLALGILGDFRAASTLGELLHDTGSGRKLVAKGEVGWRRRAFAAYALGLLGSETDNEDVRRYAVHHLVRAHAEGETSSREVEVACLIALGTVPLADDGRGFSTPEEPTSPASCRIGQLELCLEVIASPFHHRMERAHAATAIARLTDDLPQARLDELKETLVPELLRVLTRTADEPNELVQSAVLALGSLGDDDGDAADQKLRRALLGIGESQRDQGARHLALLSLARLASRPGDGDGAGSALAPVQRHLLQQLARGKSSMRPWSGLALGLLCRGLVERGEVAPREVTSALRVAMRGSETPRERGAYCLALGLARDTTAAPALARVLDDSPAEVGAYAALALGLVGDREALDEVRAALADTDGRAFLIEPLAMAARLLADDGVQATLASQLTEARSFERRAALVRALGRLGDVRALAPLIAEAESGAAMGSLRALAVSALGRVAESRDLPWATLYVPTTNYLAAPPTLFGAPACLLSNR